ncbi:phosphate signaling complex protein PhoU [Pseudemcibacter aquimaris]|uniref:phosphate signaling complex protein PhoU n=1 Tax=Pseudemcibacter aquimaris TaxID=2857064 RepID=UPI002012CB4F|nr:phosphate signaling complex protein PhoU [Pseudemcibacter aquimaris]MCC3860221.1 phosphate signaling complex protein PhoU [Pseudemcibacter aquimaris]WDU57546.1 phosphate signaling complex protein PhoU [Pseudemcibacter aquimaris]
MSNSHIVSSFDEDIKELRAKIVEMANFVEKQFSYAEEALLNQDLDLAKKIREQDKIVDDMEQNIEKKAIELIAIRSPMADDLREIISAIKISTALERIGDYAKNLSKRVTVLHESKNLEANYSVISQMISMINIMNKDVVDAYVNRNAEKAIAVWSRDMVVDNLYDGLFRQMLTYMMENPKSITPATHLLFVAKNVERAGDHITNIAELIYYIIEGTQLEMVRPKGDLSSEANVEFNAD